MPTSRPFAWCWQLALCLALAFVFVLPALAEEEGEEAKPAPAPRPELGTREAPGIGREQMWPAPTAEDWKKPVQLTFQRTWDDAITVAKETGKPILVCINMDGEIASEHWAGIRYRQPEVGKLYEQYVCVIASVYRHNPRDYDDEGHRILCPRFGSVTCGEHIWIEPIIYERFCDGQRVAPRHIAVDVDGNEAYDVFYVDDTAGVFDAIIDGRAKFPEAKPTIVRGDRPIVERVASRDVRDRTAVEAAFQKGDEALRKKLLDAAGQHKDTAQLDLLRLALFGLDVEQAKAARASLAKLEAPNATPLINEALQGPMEPSERAALIATLRRLGESLPVARWLAGVHEGLAARSGTLDVEGWSKVPTEPPPVTVPTHDALVAKAEYQAQAAQSQPKDPGPRIGFAESSLSLALEAPRTYANDQRKARMFAEHLYADARRAAREAEALGGDPWRVNAVLALTAYYTGKQDEAYERAAAAVKALPPGDASWTSMAVLAVFAESRYQAIKTAVKEKQPWPPEWLADLDAAYSVLMRHPLGTADQVVWHYEFLLWLRAHRRASGVLRAGIARFPASEGLHQRMRDRLLESRGPARLEGAYGVLLKKHDASAPLAAYAGVASIAAAENYRRTQKFDDALAAYERAMAHYERAVELDPRFRTGADHVIALIRAARARVAYQLEQDDVALAEMLASFTRSPASAGTRDGMGITPGETAQMLLARLKSAKKEAQAAELQAALETIDPELLRPDRGLLGDG